MGAIGWLVDAICDEDESGVAEEVWVLEVEDEALEPEHEPGLNLGGMTAVVLVNLFRTLAAGGHVKFSELKI